MVNLYLDEDVNILLASLLRARSIVVITTLECGLLGTDDRRQLQFASSRGAAVVTHNRIDFENLYRECIQSGMTSGGIIILIRRDVYAMARRLSRFCLTHETIENQLWYV